MSENADEAKLVETRDPYVLRARALDERLEPREIGRALFHLNQRRGFKSNRKAERGRKENEDGKIETGAKALDAAMHDAGARTLGEFLNGRETKRVRMGGENQTYDFYPQRRHVEAEFEEIWSAQAHHHPDLLTDEAKAALHRILFFQRDLKDQEVGKCTFAGWNGVPDDERRLAKAHPLFQERRLYEEVNNLKIVSPGDADRDLTLAQRDALILKLRSTRKSSFSALGKLIKLDDGERFNKESETRKDLLGDEVRAELADKKRFGDRWGFFDLDEQLKIIDRIQNEENPEVLLDWLKAEYGLDEEAAVAVGKARLPEGYGRFGETATRRLIEALKAGVVTYDKAAQAAGFHHSDLRTGEVWDRLPYYGQILTTEIAPGKAEYGDENERRFGKITNPTVHIGLRQLEKLINAVIAVHGRPDEIVVELARELKLNEEEKKKHEARIRRDTAAAVARSKDLEDAGIPDNGANRMALRMLEELNPSNPLDRRCPYCGGVIGIRALFSGEADVDHIIPYSQSLDDSAGNKIVAHRSCNRAKGNKTPYEKWGHDDVRWEIISAQVARMHRSKQWRFGPGARERLEKDGGFAARQLTDTQYLSRATAKYLSSLYTPDEGRRVYALPGRMTAMLRRIWGLNGLLPDHNYVENAHSNAPKNRLDHRHHAIDGAVAAVTDMGLMQRIATAAGRAEEKELDRIFEEVAPPWPTFRDDLKDRLARVTVSHKPDHGRKGRPSPNRDVTAGRLHNDTAYGFTGQVAADGKTPIVVHRIPFTSLKPADIADPTRIPDETLRDALFAATRDLTGKSYDQALARFAREHPTFKRIRRVRVREALNVIAIRDKEGRPYKGYKGDSNARYDVWRLPDGKWVADIVSMFDAHRPDGADRRPHPAAKKVLSLRQNDLLAVERDGETQILRVVKFSSTGQITLASASEAGALKARDAAPQDADPFKYIYSSGSGLKKMLARQVRIDPLGRVFDPGPRN
ncbi:MAG: type II CRISPR RNA-guided endonuclease Cas9 [Brevundimonas sp.]|nr:type II CRISPR RNA-guided endonuclease Cas9 [Brevundimonas sp.]MBN9464021.1 type II CRISPR RNA-guided endonuclease Cas9 [Brevundimonas sp.]